MSGTLHDLLHLLVSGRQLTEDEQKGWHDAISRDFEPAPAADAPVASAAELDSLRAQIAAAQEQLAAFQAPAPAEAAGPVPA